LFAPLAALKERLKRLRAAGNRAYQGLTDKNNEARQHKRDGEHGNASSESRFFYPPGEPTVQGMRDDGERKGLGERGNEGINELPAEHHQDPSRDKEHNDKHVIPRPPGVSIHRLSRRITHRQSKIPVMTWTLFRLWTGVRLSCR